MSSRSAFLALVPAVFLACALGGCHLIDQRDFDRNAGKPPPPPPAPAAEAGPPATLMTISFDQPHPAYENALANDVQLALARKPNVLFTVETLVPVAGDPDAQAEAARSGAVAGRQVADSIVADGADVGQIELTVRADPGRTVKQVLVIVH
jgi:hypothetical protein